MKRTAVVVILALVVLLLFSGCSFSLFASVDSLMCPPSFSEDEEELVNAFTESVGSNVVYTAPLTGEHTSAIICRSTDSDPDDEAVIFYKQRFGGSSARISFLDSSGGSWRSIADFGGYGTAVDSVVFTDMDGDGSSEVVVLWKPGQSIGRILSVYRNTKGQYKEIVNEACALISCCDINSDSCDEIVMITRSTATLVNQAMIISLRNGGITVSDPVSLDSNISSYTSVKTEKAGGSSPMRLFIDAATGGAGMITEVLSWDSEKNALVSVFTDSEIGLNTVTMRPQPVTSADIDNDGTIEIPVQREMPGSDVMLTVWSRVEGSGLEPVRRCVINTAAKYSITLEESETEGMLIRAGSDDCWVFFSADSETGEETELFSVLVMDAESYEKSADTYTLLAEGDTCVCAFVTSEGRELGVDGQILTQRFSTFTY